VPRARFGYPVVTKSVLFLCSSENLKTVPDRLETLIADKKFIQAALILTRAIRTINKDELLEIGALSDLRAYLTSQQSVLSDIMVQELGNHLYLKSHYCDSRWQAYQPGQTQLPIPKDLVKETDDGEVQRRGSIDRTNPRLSRFMKSLTHRPNRNPILNLSDDELMSLPAIHSLSTHRDVSVYGAAPSASALADQALQDERNSSVASNPELDSYAFMAMILEALSILDRLGPALEAVSQRIANELFKMVEITIDEASERYVVWKINMLA
jgi:exocyst complex component 4